MTNIESYEGIDTWRNNFMDSVVPNNNNDQSSDDEEPLVPIIIVGNKSDLRE